MKKPFNNRLQMYWAVLTVLIKYKSIWEVIPVFLEIYNEFNAFLKEIDETAIIAGITSHGSTEEKQNVKDELAQEVFRIGSALSTYAVRTNNPKLKEKVNFSESDLKGLAQPKLLTKSRETGALMQDNLEALANFGITSTDHQLLVQLTDKYAEVIPAPQVTAGQRKDANSKLKILFSKTSTLLQEQTDKMMENFRKPNSDFYNEYWNARNIVDFGMRHERKPDDPKGPDAPKA